MLKKMSWAIKAHSDELRLMCAAAAEGCGGVHWKKSLIFRTAPFHHSQCDQIKIAKCL